MGIMDMMTARMASAEPVEVPPFVKSDVSGLSDRELAESIHEKLERFEYFTKAFTAQASASPLLASFVPKL